MHNITIKDIAIKTGFSVSTVSRALNDHPYINVETKKIINKVANDFGYKPNIVAKNLKSSKSNQIGVIVPEIHHDFFANAISGIEEVAYRNGYTVIVSQSNEDMNREKINLNSMVLNRVAGIIASISQTTDTSQHFQQLLNNGIKIVFFDRFLDDIDVYRVHIDDEQSAYDAVEFLINRGYKKIVHLAGPQNVGICRKRKLGYEKALYNHNLKKEIYTIECEMNEDGGYKGTDKLIKKNFIPDAIFCVNDPVAIGTIKKLREKNIKIPEQVGIVGFSNNPITEIINPSLTTIDQHAFEMGKEAAKILINQIRGKKMKSDKDVIIKSDLIIRDSIKNNCI